MIFNFEELLEKAKAVCENAYAPYSKFYVGACAFYESGEVYLGCNVENSSYGLTLCAERNAISTAIASGEKSTLKGVAIFCKNAKNCFPCGACRQWIYDFNPDALIILESESDGVSIYSIKDLLPSGNIPLES